MRVLLDHCVPRRFAGALVGHEVRTAAREGWARLKNGDLMRAGAPSFGAFITVDQNLRKQQNISALPLPVVVIVAVDNRFETLKPYGPAVLRLLGQRLEKRVYVVDRTDIG